MRHVWQLVHGYNIARRAAQAAALFVFDPNADSQSRRRSANKVDASLLEYTTFPLSSVSKQDKQALAGVPGLRSISNRPLPTEQSGCSRAAMGGVYASPMLIQLEHFFQQAVRNSYEGKLGLNDPDVTAYVARLLCEFSEADKLYQVRDARWGGRLRS